MFISSKLLLPQVFLPPLMKTHHLSRLAPALFPVSHTFIWSVMSLPSNTSGIRPLFFTSCYHPRLSLDYSEPFRYLPTPPLSWASVRPAVRMSLNICQSHHGMPHSKSSQGTQKTGPSASVSHRVLQGLAPMLSGLTSYCFSSPFTPATVASLLFAEHIRHAAQIVCNLHSSTPSLLNTSSIG